MSTSTLTKTESPEFLKEIEEIYEKPVAYQLRASSTWVTKPFRERSFYERLATIDLANKKVYELKQTNPNKPPVHSVWQERLWLLLVIPPALIIQALWYHFVPETSYYHTWHPAFAFVFYLLAFVVFTLQLVGRCHHFMKYYGTFDEDKRPRDHVPDKLIPRLVISVVMYFIVRTTIGLVLGGYNRYEPPALGRTISWFVLVKVGLWLIALDMFFYTYHRTVHAVPFLWKIHSLHHCTKHPTPLQSILAGDIQDMIEIVIIPILSTLVVPLTSHEFWEAQCVLIYMEAGGHSGIRAYWPHVLLYEFLVPFGMELCIEDHDLHHRYGKSGMNYGKQTRIFDRIFGTCSDRIECEQK